MDGNGPSLSTFEWEDPFRLTKTANGYVLKRLCTERFQDVDLERRCCITPA